MGINPYSSDAVRSAKGGFVITPGASPLPYVTRGILVGTAGSVTVTMYPSGDSITFPLLAAGIIHPIAASHVTAATAVDLIGLG